MPRLLYAATIAITIRGVRIPYAKHFRSLGWQVDAMAHGVTSSEECRAAFDHVWDVDWSRNPLDLHNLTSAARRVREVVENGYDIVHVHTPVAGFVTRYALRHRRGRSPLVIYGAHGFHFYPGGPALKNAAFLALEKLAGRWADYLMVVNHTDEEAARRYGIVSPDRVRYMPGSGIDLSRFTPESVARADVARVREELGLTQGEPLLLILAEFNPGKRHRDALHAFARLTERRAHMAFAGHGPLMAALQRLSGELGIADRVHFLGPRYDVPALTLASTATLLPSEREGLPRSVIESMSLGVPVIGTAIRGIQDLLGDGRGFLVEVGDIEGLTRAMNLAITADNLARSRAALARRHVAQYDIKNLLRLHEQFYGELGVSGCTGMVSSGFSMS
jgi:glycosyltransferase involved in cell wall biosynthesis